MLTEENLVKMLTAPSRRLIADISEIDGDIIILGAGGKMGPTLCMLASNAARAAGIDKKITAVSRFTDASVLQPLCDAGVKIIACDLLDVKTLNALPDAKNVIFMAGRKFGTEGEAWRTWGANAVLPAFVCDRYKESNILAFSSGNIYAPAPLSSGGSVEDDPPGPVGEYAMSCLARERIFERAANAYGANVLLFRLNYAVDLRYGVLCDIAEKLIANIPISLETPAFNIIWQGAANEMAIRGLRFCASPAFILNITGPEIISVRYAAERMAKTLCAEPVFTGEEQGSAYLSDASRAMKLFGYPAIGADALIDMQAEWIKSGNRRLNKPTHFEERGGRF